MPSIKKTISIDAPVAEVIAFTTNPHRLLEIWPSMMEVRNVQVRPDRWHSFDWTYKMAGMRFRGHAETEDIIPERRVLVRNKSGIPSTFDWHFETAAGKTQVTLEVEYEIPSKILKKLAGALVHRRNEHEAELLLANLKSELEHHLPAAEPHPAL